MASDAGAAHQRASSKIGRLERVTELLAGRRTKWLLLVLWLAVIVVATPLAGRLSSVEENDAAAYLPRTAESTQVIALQPRFFGAEPIPAIVVYVREGGIVPADQEKVEQDRQALAPLVPGGEVPPPVLSDDGAALLLTIPLARDEADEEALFGQVAQIRATVAENVPPGLQVKVTGPAGSLTDVVKVFASVDTPLLVATVSVVTILLLLIYRSPILWLLPLICVGIASQVANAVVYLLARYGDLTVSGQSAGILTVLVFGAGTDYALLMLARYREELRRHLDRHQAMAVALRRAGPAIIGSAGTTMAGLLCLLVAELNSNRGLGPVAAAGIVSAFLAMMTLLPALLVILGRWLFWPFIPRAGAAESASISAWGRVAGWVGRRQRPAWLGSVAVLAALALGLVSMDTGLSAEEQFTRTPESVEGQRLLAAHFPAGAAAPAYIIANAGAEAEVTSAISATDGVATIQPPLRADGTGSEPPLVLIPVVLSDPPDSRAAEQTIARLREAVRAVPDAQALVGGNTAVALDTRLAAGRDERVIIPLVLLVVVVIIAVLLRALVAPLVLLAANILSFFAALGGSVLLFEWVFGFPAIGQSVRLLGFIFLVALGIDYTIFLMTRAREEVERLGHRQGVLWSLTVTGGVITSAAMVLAATFSVLSVLPLVVLVQLGVLVAFGVALDAILVRSFLVPALTLELGPRVWWPGRLARRTEAATVEHAPATVETRVHVGEPR